MDEEEKVEGHGEVRGEIGSTSLAAVGLGAQGGAIAARAIKFCAHCFPAAVFRCLLASLLAETVGIGPKGPKGEG